MIDIVECIEFSRKKLIERETQNMQFCLTSPFVPLRFHKHIVVIIQQGSINASKLQQTPMRGFQSSLYSAHWYTEISLFPCIEGISIHHLSPFRLSLTAVNLNLSPKGEFNAAIKEEILCSHHMDPASKRVPIQT